MTKIEYNIVKIFSSCKTYLSIAEDPSVKKNYSDSCKSIIKTKLNLSDNYTDVCAVIKGYLTYFSINPAGYNNNVYCGYLNYWLNERLRKLNEYAGDATTFYTTFSNNDNDFSTKLNMCQGKIFHLDVSEFNNTDVLYKIYEAFREFKSKVRNTQNHNDSCKYAKECSRLYKSIINQCVPDKSNSLCDELNIIRNEFYTGEWLIGKNICMEADPLLSPEEIHKKQLEHSIQRTSGGEESSFLTPTISFSMIIFGIVSVLIILFKKKMKKLNLYDEYTSKLIEHNREPSDVNFKNVPNQISYHPI
ncbi:PIR protein [Plasmodium vivax]|uniref:VIR protein n=1 Tax=Plasmodium vivax TaxID=5855 RepID=A0A565A3M4_PLAVI|nr:PIR protein [Plasmodium vivax]